ncbi:MAG: class I SAM-dependent methyltransferase [Rubrobacter sp.]
MWPSAIALARNLYDQDLTGIRAIELGCGVGLPTVAALSSGASVLATDHYEAALDFTAHNARKNVGREPETALLDWRTPDVQHPRAFDLVLGADVLYERPNAVALADLVPGLLAPGGEALFADPRRDEAQTFLGMMEEKGFETRTRNATVRQAEREVKVSLHRLLRW